MELSDRIAAVVTGGGSGLGEATARALAEKGVKVAVFDISEAAGERVAYEIGGLYCQVNVADEASVDFGFAKARGAHGQERVLINCAGTGSAVKTVTRNRETGMLGHFPIALFEHVVRVNLIGTFCCSAKSALGMCALEPLGDHGRGVIINTSSVAAEDGQIGQAAYAASKGGVVSLTLPMARDLRREGIRVNAILPGVFDTPLFARASDVVRDGLTASILFPSRFGRPDEFAAFAVSLVENDYVNGEDIRLDGGVRMGAR